jgi:hypothetical protein
MSSYSSSYLKVMSHSGIILLSVIAFIINVDSYNEFIINISNNPNNTIINECKTGFITWIWTCNVLLMCFALFAAIGLYLYCESDRKEVVETRIIVAYILFDVAFFCIMIAGIIKFHGKVIFASGMAPSVMITVALAAMWILSVVSMASDKSFVQQSSLSSLSSSMTSNSTGNTTNTTINVDTLYNISVPNNTPAITPQTNKYINPLDVPVQVDI